MNTYIFKGLILPERAQLSIGPLKTRLKPFLKEEEIEVELNIVLNQITVWVFTDNDYDVFDLRNIVRAFVNNVCSWFALIKGYAYEVEIRQVLNYEKKIDCVFGIDLPCITNRHSDSEINLMLLMLDKLMKKSSGENGIYIQRCITDLRLALSNTEDTPFYCFRSIESLKHYCKYEYGIEDEKEQWKKIIEITGFNKTYIDDIRKMAFPQRHGDVINFTSDDRVKMLSKTWDVVEKFLLGI